MGLVSIPDNISGINPEINFGIQAVTRNSFRTRRVGWVSIPDGITIPPGINPPLKECKSVETDLRVPADTNACGGRVSMPDGITIPPGINPLLKAYKSVETDSRGVPADTNAYVGRLQYPTPKSNNINGGIGIPPTNIIRIM